MATKQFLGGRILLGTEFIGYKYRVYNPGTSTLKTTYKDSSLTAGNENTSTITLDANGAAQIWFGGNADVTFFDPNLVVIYTDNNVNLDDTSTSTGNSNLSLNASFEDDTTGDGIPDSWTRTLYTGGTFTLDTTDSFNGSKCIKFDSVGTGGGYIVSESNFAVSPSIAYTVGFTLKGTADVRNVVEIIWYKKDGTASATPTSTVYDDSTTNPTSWTEKWYEVISPSDAALAKIRITGCHSSDVTVGTTRFDQIIFTDVKYKRATDSITGTTLALSSLADLSASGAGQIKFPAIQNASSNANTLDDYEEGTWTPSLGGNTTYTIQIGIYIKIGKLVYISLSLTINAIGTGDTTTIAGLPFSGSTSVFSVATFISIATAIVSATANITIPATSIAISSRTVASTSQASNAIFGNSAGVNLAGTYSS